MIAQFSCSAFAPTWRISEEEITGSGNVPDVT